MLLRANNTVLYSHRGNLIPLCVQQYKKYKINTNIHVFFPKRFNAHIVRYFYVVAMFWPLVYKKMFTCLNVFSLLGSKLEAS